MITDIQKLIDDAINEDVTYQSKPLDLRNQRTYAVKVVTGSHHNTRLKANTLSVRRQWFAGRC